MPVIRQEGKDTIIFVSKEEHSTPSKVKLPEPEPSPGLLLPNGEINWNCPCLGGMATGPCGLEFRDAFACFHYSVAEPKGSDCYEAFKTMQTCMSEYPALYGNKDPDLDNMDGHDADAIVERGSDIVADKSDSTNQASVEREIRGANTSRSNSNQLERKMDK